MAKKTARKTCWTTARSHSSLVGGRLTACGSRIMMRWPPPFSSTSLGVAVIVGGHGHPKESPGKGNTPAWNEKALPPPLAPAPPPPLGPKGAVISSAGSAPPMPMWAASRTANGFRNAGARKEGAGGGGAAGRGRGGIGRDLQQGRGPVAALAKGGGEGEEEGESALPTQRWSGNERKGTGKERAHRGSTASAEV